MGRENYTKHRDREEIEIEKKYMVNKNDFSVEEMEDVKERWLGKKKPKEKHKEGENKEINGEGQ